jgi:hypothetical protein
LGDLGSAGILDLEIASDKNKPGALIEGFLISRDVSGPFWTNEEGIEANFARE